MRLRKTRELLARIRRRLTYSNVMATIAGFLALGGTANAWIIVDGKNSQYQLAKNSVGSREIKTNAVGAKELKQSAFNALLPKTAGALSTTPMTIPGGAGFTQLAAKGFIIVGGKSNLLLVGQVSVEDADRMSASPAAVEFIWCLDGQPVGTPIPTMISDDLTYTTPVSFLVPDVPAGEHTVGIEVANMGATGITVKLAGLSVVAIPTGNL